MGIGNGTTEQLRNFKRQFEVSFEFYTDPSLNCFRAYRMKRKFGVGPRAIVRYLKAMAAGHRQGWIQGDPWQQGGVAIIDETLNSIWSHVDDGPGDHAAPATIVNQFLLAQSQSQDQ